jgi:hypothetical protein
VCDLGHGYQLPAHGISAYLSPRLASPRPASPSLAGGLGDMTPRRANEEQQPLLPSSCTRTPKARPWWAFWGRPRAGALGHVRFVERSDDEEEEDNLTATHRKKGRMTKCKHASIYVIVLLVGAVLGGWLSRALEGRKDGPSDGPMVPPVYTLPPVRSSSPCANQG